MPILTSEGCFWPLAASITSKAKINYAYVNMQGICNSFIEVNLYGTYGLAAKSSVSRFDYYVSY